MTTSSLPEQIAEEAAQLTPADQQRALDFVHLLRTAQSQPPGPNSLSSPDNLLKFVGAIPREELDEMERILEEGCENIDDGEW